MHHRAIPENLIAIEVRKATSHQPPEHDQQKLRGLTDPHLWFAYQIGVLVTLAENNVAASEVYVGGQAGRGAFRRSGAAAEGRGDRRRVSRRDARHRKRAEGRGCGLPLRRLPAAGYFPAFSLIR